ncbi:MAG TPA: acyltransferase [Acidobacteriaceae bacterium]|nr:acyltransferase [Acidobacteriaceae bacterium]
MNLDLLRAVAVMAVFFDHLSGALHNRSFGSLGRFGVILFFLHTSFVLMASLERLDTPDESAPSIALAFWIRRFFRIYPLAVLFILLVPIFHIPSDPGLTYVWIGAKGFFSNLALTQNLTYSNDILSPLWSLPLEVQMYLLLPFAYFAIRGNRRFRSLALWGLSVGLALTVPRISQRLDVFMYAPCFTSGIVAYDLLRSQRWSRKLPAWAWPIGIFAMIALFGPHDNISLPNKIVRAWMLSLLLAILYANVREGRSNWIQHIFHWIAEHSYGIYLSHIVLFWIIFYRMALFPSWARMVALMAGAIGIPALLYVSLEKPCILAGAHLARRLLRRSVERKQGQPV